LTSRWTTFHNETIPKLIERLKAPLKQAGGSADDLANRMSDVSRIEDLARKAGAFEGPGGLTTRLNDRMYLGAVRDRIAGYRESIAGFASKAELEAIDAALGSLEGSHKALAGARAGLAGERSLLDNIGRTLLGNNYAAHPWLSTWRAYMDVNALTLFGYNMGVAQRVDEYRKSQLSNGGAAGGMQPGTTAGGQFRTTSDADGNYANPSSAANPNLHPAIEVRPGQPRGDAGADPAVQPDAPPADKAVKVQEVQRTAGVADTNDMARVSNISHSGEPAIVTIGPFRVVIEEPVSNYASLIEYMRDRFGMNAPWSPKGVVEARAADVRPIAPFANKTRFTSIDNGPADFAKISYTPFAASSKPLLSLLEAAHLISANHGHLVHADGTRRGTINAAGQNGDPATAALRYRGLAFAVSLGGEGKLNGDPTHRERTAGVNTDRATQGGGGPPAQTGIQFTAVAAPPGMPLTTGAAATGHQDEDGNGSTAVASATGTSDPGEGPLNLTTV
jgi:hypothetical protein